jgi:D-amino-acid dehydrogenase
MTPTGVPIIGRSPVDRVYLNTGHGSLGWTMACGSAVLIADLLEGRSGELDPSDYESGLPAD